MHSRVLPAASESRGRRRSNWRWSALGRTQIPSRAAARTPVRQSGLEASPNAAASTAVPALFSKGTISTLFLDAPDLAQVSVRSSGSLMATSVAATIPWDLICNAGSASALVWCYRNRRPQSDDFLRGASLPAWPASHHARAAQLSETCTCLIYLHFLHCLISRWFCCGLIPEISCHPFCYSTDLSLRRHYHSGED